MFPNIQNQSEEVEPSTIINLFGVIDKSTIRCVILNSCYSEEQAEAFAKCVDCVRGTNKNLSEEAARDFIVYFYQSLGLGTCTKEAFELSIGHLELFNITKEKMPTLHDGLDPSQIILSLKKQESKLISPNSKSAVHEVELPNLPIETSKLNQQYNELTRGLLSVEEFWNILLPFLRLLLGSQESMAVMGSQNVDTLNLALINLSSMLAAYRRERDGGEDQNDALVQVRHC
jgi:hypothetical protein